MANNHVVDALIDNKKTNKSLIGLKIVIKSYSCIISYNLFKEKFKHTIILLNEYVPAIPEYIPINAV